MKEETGSRLHERESAFHDEGAQNTKLEEVDIDSAFEAITAPEHKHILDVIGNIKGKRIADIGCGLGEASIYFAKQGAHVTAIDLSPEMVKFAKRNAEELGLSLEGFACAAESIELPESSYDVAYAGNLIHHIQDKDQFYRGIYRILKPGGLFIAWDPLKYNPIIEVYRMKATEVRTEDEAPLGYADLKEAKKYFPNLQHKEFWFFTLALFLKYFLFNRYDVNQTRYWKRILKETDDTIGWWFKPLAALDRYILSLPLVRFLAWNMVQWGNKPEVGSSTHSSHGPESFES